MTQLLRCFATADVPLWSLLSLVHLCSQVVNFLHFCNSAVYAQLPIAVSKRVVSKGKSFSPVDTVFSAQSYVQSGAQSDVQSGANIAKRFNCEPPLFLTLGSTVNRFSQHCKTESRLSLGSSSTVSSPLLQCSDV